MHRLSMADASGRGDTTGTPATGQQGTSGGQEAADREQNILQSAPSIGWQTIIST